MPRSVTYDATCIFGHLTVHKTPSYELTCGRKRLFNVEVCLMFGVVALTSRRVMSLSSPRSMDECLSDVRCSNLD